uniref:Uncharacterized protein n=1 Tax=Siphoviridae sp. ctoRD1 TaxID=2825669 RepID=A0A8S5QFB7_9CAUD|nr:MAG TPA: hypothetical protein [Siphoviridae sp. ctoRD1]
MRKPLIGPVGIFEAAAVSFSAAVLAAPISPANLRAF